VLLELAESLKREVPRRTAAQVSVIVKTESAWVSRRLHTLEVRMEHDRTETFPEAIPPGAKGAGDQDGRTAPT
jgi:hypothetical protein